MKMMNRGHMTGANYNLIICLMMGITIACTQQVKAQNINFSQYRDAAFFTNPGLIASKSEVSASAIHRSQQLTDLEKYNSTSIMVAAPLIDMKKGIRWGGWGLSLVNDGVKGGGTYRLQGVSAAYAYNLAISHGHYISFGMQGGYYQRKISTTELTTSSQWIPNSGFDPSTGLGESFSAQRSDYFSIGTGFLFYKEDNAQRHVAQLGIGAYNINRPNASFTNRTDVIPVKLTALGSLALMRGVKTLLNAEMFFYHENGVNTYHPGVRYSFYFGNDNPFDAVRDGSIDFKAGYRVNNAITTELQFHQPNFSVGLGYDIGIASREGRGGPNDVVEVLFTFKKLIPHKKSSKSSKKNAYSTIGEVREFYFGKSPARSETERQGEGGVDETEQASNANAEDVFEFKLKHDFKFGFNDATLDDESKAYLDDMVALLNSNKNFKLEVIGHTDNIGSHAGNLEVSLRRANTVITYLVQKGIDPSRLQATAMGAKEPLVPNNSEDNRAKNRRVEFVIKDLSKR